MMVRENTVILNKAESDRYYATFSGPLYRTLVSIVVKCIDRCSFGFNYEVCDSLPGEALSDDTFIGLDDEGAKKVKRYCELNNVKSDACSYLSSEEGTKCELYSSFEFKQGFENSYYPSSIYNFIFNCTSSVSDMIYRKLDAYPIVAMKDNSLNVTMHYLPDSPLSLSSISL